MSTVLIVDDHPLFRSGLNAVLTASGHDVVGEAASGTEAIARASELRPELVLIDLGLPDMDGRTALARIVGERPECRVVVLSMFDDDASVRQALAAGALGYVVKDSPPAEVLAAVQAAGLGASYLSSGLVRTSLDGAESMVAPTLIGMTPRERAVAGMLAQGLPNRIIAERLGVAEKTVANYVSAVLLKLGAVDRQDAARIVRGG